ncbi:MAG: glycosyltransferase [Lachnospiraceae bacterium]|nr:glycosyltransferase [Lachnospiraceae bacterium]
MKKKVLFVINTLSRAGAETALLELLRNLDPNRYEISLFVLTGQGELISDVPPGIRLLNRDYEQESVLSASGKKRLMRLVLRGLVRNGNGIRLAGYLIRGLADMIKKRKLAPDKLFWRVLSDSAMQIEESFDLAVAYIEGGSAYYVADHVNAKRKAAFIHIDYPMAGYTRQLDQDCYRKYDRIFAVSGEVRSRFLEVYPEHREKADVFHNLLNREEIQRKAGMDGGFTDDYAGNRILTVGRLTQQKAFEVSIEAMRLLKEKGANVRWYVLGEGDQREKLEAKIRRLGLEADFLLPGAVENPYPYFAQTDLYVHASRYEGKSIAIQEAQTLGCTILVSDCPGNREQVTDGVDGRMCSFSPEAICDAVIWLLEHPNERKQYAEAAKEKQAGTDRELEKLTGMLDV